MKRLLMLIISIILLTGCTDKSVSDIEESLIEKEHKYNQQDSVEENKLEEIVKDDQPLEDQDVNLEKKEVLWAGRYNEYYTYSSGYKTLSNESYKKEHIPYIELFEDGTYEINANWFEGMGMLSGTWRVDEKNINIAYLSKSLGINHEIIIEKISDVFVILKVVHYFSYSS